MDARRRSTSRSTEKPWSGDSDEHEDWEKVLALKGLELGGELQPFLQALANFRQKALLAGKRLTDEEAARWITTGGPRIPYTPGLPESGAALRAAALALSAKAIAIQAQRLKELRAASQIN